MELVVALLMCELSSCYVVFATTQLVGVLIRRPNSQIQPQNVIIGGTVCVRPRHWQCRRTHKGSIVPIYLCIKSYLALDIQNCQAGRFLSFPCTHTHTKQTHTSKNSLCRYLATVSMQYYVHRRGQYKKPLQTFQSPLSIKASLLLSSPPSLLTTLILPHTAAAFTPSVSLFFLKCGSFLFLLFLMIWNTKLCFLCRIFSPSFYYVLVSCVVFLTNATIEYSYLKQLLTVSGVIHATGIYWSYIHS